MRDEKFQQNKKPDANLVEKIRTAFTHTRETTTSQAPPMSQINRRDAEKEAATTRNHAHNEDQETTIDKSNRRETRRAEREPDEREPSKPRKEKREIVEERLERGESVKTVSQIREKGALASREHRVKLLFARHDMPSDSFRPVNTEEDNAPIRFTGIPLEEQKKQYNAAMLRAANATDDLYSFLRKSGVEVQDLPIEHQEEIEKYEKDIVKKAVLGTLTDKERKNIFESIQEFFETLFGEDDDVQTVQIERIQEEKMEFHPKITLNMIKKPEIPKYVIPQLGLVETDVLGKEDLDQILRYGEKYSDDKELNEIYKNMRAYKQEIFQQANDAYNAGIQNGDVKPYDYRRFYDHAVLEIYETCTKPLLVETLVDGKKKKVMVPIGELIAPYDDSFGAQVAREATRLVGVKYNEPSNLGYFSKMRIDCSKLVVWAVSEVDKNIGTYGLSKKAEYQMDAIEEIVWPNGKNEGIDRIKLLPGDTLYWKGDETGEIKHTAIYIGRDKFDNPLMIEAGTTVKIVPIRKNTTNNNGEGSTLYQIKRMSWKDLSDNAKKNKNKH